MLGTQDQKVKFTGPLELEGEPVELEPPQAAMTTTIIRAKHTLIPLARRVPGREKYCMVSKLLRRHVPRWTRDAIFTSVDHQELLLAGTTPFKENRGSDLTSAN